MTLYLLNSDNRLKFLHIKLINKNIPSLLEDFENIVSNAKENSTIIFPPNFKWTLDKAILMPKKSVIVSGNVSDEILEMFKDKNIKYFNLMQDETFVLKNAILTAEGFLADLILNTPNSIFDQKILILGGGRVAKTLAILFQKLGINFDVTMRNPLKLKEAQIFTPNLVDWKHFKKKLKGYNTIINTIPCELFSKEDLLKFGKDTVIFELSSLKVLPEQFLNKNLNSFAPFTNLFSLNIANSNIKYVLSPALPGRYSPQSAGELIFEYLKTYKILKK